MELIRNYLSCDDEDDQELHLSCPVRGSASNPHSALTYHEQIFSYNFLKLGCRNTEIFKKYPGT
jgi:hypothetical protein